jgi:hypothetical protein
VEDWEAQHFLPYTPEIKIIAKPTLRILLGMAVAAVDLSVRVAAAVAVSSVA